MTITTFYRFSFYDKLQPCRTFALTCDCRILCRIHCKHFYFPKCLCCLPFHQVAKMATTEGEKCAVFHSEIFDHYECTTQLFAVHCIISGHFNIFTTINKNNNFVFNHHIDIMCQNEHWYTCVN